MSRIVLMGIILIWTDFFVSALVHDSYCVNYHNSKYETTARSPIDGSIFTVPIPVANETITYGAVNCTLGDIVLQGKYINLGE
jgi:hypothetical protein